MTTETAGPAGTARSTGPAAALYYYGYLRGRDRPA
jgi:hypothetical protein